jgi:hypothetical protein
MFNAALHVIEYFRKQKMRYWRPINVAELAALQQEAPDGLDDNGDCRRMLPRRSRTGSPDSLLNTNWRTGGPTKLDPPLPAMPHDDQFAANSARSAPTQRAQLRCVVEDSFRS